KVIFQPEVISAPTQRYLHWIQKLGKWSMLDVFVVAVLVVAVKLRAIAEVQMHYGLYAFAVSVLLTMWLSSKLSKYLQIQ
ncbi:MAG: paraquat-inducible protein A, partial [Arenicellales bacterium]